MYLFSKYEIELIKCASSINVPLELRGWELKKDYTKLNGVSISNIVSTYCNTNRKIYQLNKGIDYGQSEAMIFGSAVHSIVEKIYEKKLLHSDDTDELQLSLTKLKEDNVLTFLIWNGDKLQVLHDLSSNDKEYEMKLDRIKKTMMSIIDYEIERIINPNLSDEVQILDLERYVNGSSLSIGTGKIDVVFRYKDSIGIGDLKTGKPWKDNHDYKVQIAVYAMLLEAEIKRKIDWGVVIFPFEFNDGNRNLRDIPLKDVFPISSELRMEVIERFDIIEELLLSEHPPQICNKCKTRSICSQVV